MSRKLTSGEQQNELTWEEAVGRYLEDNPDYFLRHGDVLASLQIPHPETGDAISLVERQLQALRDQNHRLQQQLRELVAIARENDVLGERLHHFAQAMIDAASIDDALNTAQDLLRQEFKLDQVVIRFLGNAPGTAGRPEFTDADDHQLKSLLKQFVGGRPICGGKYDDRMMVSLFGTGAAEIKSTAMIALGGEIPRGVLCLGSRDPHRFHPDMGTVYLVRLGELLMRGAAKYLR
ncbi:MAG: DUF484 family protein [Acidiferrobacterales bacterium]